MNLPSGAGDEGVRSMYGKTVASVALAMPAAHLLLDKPRLHTVETQKPFFDGIFKAVIRIA